MWFRRVVMGLVAMGLSLVAAFAQMSASGSGSQAEGDDILAKIFTPWMLNVKLAYFEKVTGPARTSFSGAQTGVTRREYNLDEGCTVWADVANNQVLSLRVELGPKCTVDLNKFRPYGELLPTANRLTVGRFSSSVDSVKFASDWIRLSAMQRTRSCSRIIMERMLKDLSTWQWASAWPTTDPSRR